MLKNFGLPVDQFPGPRIIDGLNIRVIDYKVIDHRNHDALWGMLGQLEERVRILYQEPHLIKEEIEKIKLNFV